jgi:hypothetical protein
MRRCVMIGKHARDQEGAVDQLRWSEAELLHQVRGDDDPCGEWKAYADRCYDYGLQQGKAVAEAERVKIFEEGLKTGLETAVAKSDVLLSD